MLPDFNFQSRKYEKKSSFGMMECCNNGKPTLKRVPKPNIPFFQYSNWAAVPPIFTH